jgi:hypothetical protein
MVENYIMEKANSVFPAEELWIDENRFVGIYRRSNYSSITTGLYDNGTIVFDTFTTENSDESIYTEGMRCFAMCVL